MRYLQPLLALVLLTLSGCGATEQGTVSEPVALVTLAPAVSADIPIVIHGYGRIEFDPSTRQTLNAEIEARLLEIAVTAGDVVEPGQLLARLEPSTTGDTELAQARRDAAAALATAERTRRLRADGLASDADVESADTAARDLAAKAQSLETRADSILSLRAPGRGVVDGVLAQPGDLIAPAAPIISLASPTALQARIGVEIEDAPGLQAGDPVTLRSLDNADTRVDAVIRLIDTRVDPATHMAAALVTVPPGQGFLAGEGVRAEITAGIHKAAVTVPRPAVFNDERGPYVFLARGGKAALHRVETGVTSGDSTEIERGIKAGDILVVEGAAVLADGMKIRTATDKAGDE